MADRFAISPEDLHLSPVCVLAGRSSRSLRMAVASRLSQRTLRSAAARRIHLLQSSANVASFACFSKKVSPTFLATNAILFLQFSRAWILELFSRELAIYLCKGFFCEEATAAHAIVTLSNKTSTRLCCGGCTTTQGAPLIQMIKGDIHDSCLS